MEISELLTRPRLPGSSTHTSEMVDWIRYHYVDLNWHFNTMTTAFTKQFPFFKGDVTVQTFSARLSRDNYRPHLDGNNEVQFERGKVKMVKFDMRRKSPGTDDGFPISLTQKWPAKLILYDWGTIEKEHKQRAKEIVEGCDPDDDDTR